jgi:PRD1 phage membrane DNA delivery
MADKWMTEIVGVATAIVSLALIAVVVGKNSKTPDVITSAGTALSNVIGAAVKPVM